MRFLILMAEEDHFNRWDASTEEDQQRFFDSLRAFAAAVRERGAIVVGEALARPEQARTLRHGTVTEGPYTETTELVGGLYIVDLPNLATAVEIARLLDSPATEVRPILDVSSDAAGVD